MRRASTRTSTVQGLDGRRAHRPARSQLDKKLMKEVVPWVPCSFDATTVDIIEPRVTKYDFDQYGNETGVLARRGRRVSPNRRVEAMSGAGPSATPPPQVCRRLPYADLHRQARRLGGRRRSAVVLAITFAIFFVLPSGDPALRLRGQGSRRRSRSRRSGSSSASTSRGTGSTSSSSGLVTGDEYGWPGLGYSYDTRRPGARGGEDRERPARCSLIVGRGDPLAGDRGRDRRHLRDQAAARAIDRASMGFALFGVSAPVFWLGLVALFIFWEKLGIAARHGLRAVHRRARRRGSRTWSCPGSSSRCCSRRSTRA